MVQGFMEVGMRRRLELFLTIVVIAVGLWPVVLSQNADDRVRARDLGITPGVFPPGELNAITDVAGVSVGHTTIIAGDNIRTGVTAIVPHSSNLSKRR